MRKNIIPLTIWVYLLFCSGAISVVAQNTFPLNDNVGIGTTSPQAKLHLANGDFLLQNSTSGYPILWSKDLTGTKTLRLDYNSIIVQGGDALLSAHGNNILLNTTAGGNVGIGTTMPQDKLHISNGNLRFDSGYEIFFADNGQIRSLDNNHRILFRRSENKMELREFGDIIFSPGATSGVETSKIVMLANGNVGIGTSDPQGYRLAVNGDAIFTKIKVKQYSAWPDYVFYPSYSLRPLTEVEKYIQQHRHLPDVPSAAEVEKEGLDLTDNHALLLKKIEELTLYLIEQNKKLEAQQLQLQRQQQEMEQLKKENGKKANQ